MISNLRRENQVLREKLKMLKKVSTAGNLSRKSSPAPSTGNFDGKAETVENGNNGPELLSNKAKVVRGEASKRIGLLLQDWREFKEKQEEELRHRIRTEQNLKEMIMRKDSELDELRYEVSSYQALAMEQKNSISILMNEKELAQKTQNRCTELEKQVGRENRRSSDLTFELKSRDEMLRSIVAEKESLLAMNSELRSINEAQKRKLEICERDVTETGYELELLEEMVKHLQNPKSFLTAFPTPQKSSTRRTSQPFKERPATPSTPLPTVFNFNPNKNSTEMDESAATFQKNHAQHKETSARTRVVASSSEGSSNNDSQGSSDKTFSSKKSALSALKSLQKDHDERCSFLAEHIQKLKEENAEKEMRLRQLEQSTS